jgi:hypothetical protein
MIQVTHGQEPAAVSARALLAPEAVNPWRVFRTGRAAFTSEEHHRYTFCWPLVSAARTRYIRQPKDRKVPQ